MRIVRYVIVGAIVSAAASSLAEPAVALHGGRTITIEQTLADPNDLWVTPADLTRINGFVIKPEGACLADICIPLKADDSKLWLTRDGQQWINASELARRVKEGLAADPEARVWSFGEVPAAIKSYLDSAVAPEFELPDRSGKIVRLSDFRGKKVLLVTWASW